MLLGLWQDVKWEVCCGHRTAAGGDGVGRWTLWKERASRQEQGGKEPRGWLLKTISPPPRAASLLASPRVSDQYLGADVLLPSLGLVTGLNIWFVVSCFHVGWPWGSHITTGPQIPHL